MKITLEGQVRGGKNNMIVLRNGVHIPKPVFKRWRDEAVRQVTVQMGSKPPIVEPCWVEVKYRAGDRRRRDIPALMDAIWHVLERAGVVNDDALITGCCWESGYDKERPGVELRIEEIEREEGSV